jgi:hypothetical protein
VYRAFYGPRALHDPYSDDVLHDLKIEAALDESGTCKFTMPPTHALRHEIRERDGSAPVTVLDGDVLLFSGFVYEATQTMWDELEVTCKGDLAYLGDTRVRPYCTDRSSKDWRADMVAPPDDLAGYFGWLISQHDERCGESKRFEVGVNEGGIIDPDGHILRSSTQVPTTASEIEEKVLKPFGCHVFVRHEGGRRIIDLRAGFSEVATQVIDFGESITDYQRTDSTDGLATAVRVEGKADGDNPPPTLAATEDGLFSAYPGYSKRGDVVYDEAAVERYGVIEDSVSSDAQTQDGLAQAAVSALGSSSSVATTIEVKAIDRHLATGSGSPIVPGQIVRVRSRPHGIDRYMLVSGMDIDCDDPENTTYTLGAVRSGITRQLDESVDRAVDAVAPIAQDAAAARKSAEDAAAETRDLVTLRIDSSRGTVFRNASASTVLTVRCYKRGAEITTLSGLRDALGDQTARIRWWVLREGDADWVSLSASDPMLSQDGFALTITPDDVEVKCTFKAEVVTD